MGISLAHGRLSPEAQALVLRAMRGEKKAQLELGARFEEGRGAPLDPDRAAQFYSLAAANGGGLQLMYIRNGKSISAVPVSTGRSPNYLGRSSRAAAGVYIDWKAFSEEKRKSDCIIMPIRGALSCNGIKRPLKTYDKRIGYIVEIREYSPGISGEVVCGFAFCRDSKNIYANYFYRDGSYVGFVYKGYTLCGFVLSRDISGYTPGDAELYDFLFIPKKQCVKKINSIASYVKSIIESGDM